MIEVARPGLQTTVQDAGRFGHRALGVGQAGAADAGALRLANLLVGNPPGCAALEITLLGPTLRFTRGALAALAGADPGALLNGRRVKPGQPFDIKAGSTLQLPRCRHGARCYLAFAGGLEVTEVLGSASTDLGAGFGHALQRGDRLRLRTPRPPRLGRVRWWAEPPEDRQRMGLPAEVLRILPDADAALPADLTALEWQVDGRSSRKALRLQGPALAIESAAERVSAPVAPGDVQILPDGEPLLLGVEAQTVGGYPLLGRVIRADRDRLGQLRPGDSVRFLLVDRAAADAAWRSLQAGWFRLETALAARRAGAG
ncbi:biotin-dependent carboxyltransferase family protein [Pseudomarimonas salicorniae]|uniref:Biotin-dependent carboxyltransferase family protein n=1 Tax=Pseudomarimonas salicorniae TaxID=2933270 RepID=A0ABT0GHX3_9GAMM|nr:biotin-dependent carboxyltransferase family protein [Lysobacter sp. CAU 1642]MCK7594144.1 biotin-dependent carboxyltransferase family protein [Lysobacter sp. CAU 1642]